ncbi:MAG: hypothetical protein G3M70_03670 [Candidatus Nitronauta litoralis]|uniref:HAMP domain-containing protein n=1 Tax=Candidatus Nitronauta litoralis TaxID=2705533 RepID=A0A7T0BU64_9BACT|nr:MAG: hypothetical protein G3M70_03670 [Candidatus Nitronauta litoralis]
MLSWFLNMRIRTKVFAGFTLVTLILLVVILVIIQLVKEIESTTHRVVDLRSPTAQASLMMLNGMNHSLASLRGWVILGEEQFKKEREDAWKTQIDASLKQLNILATEWTDLENIQRLQKVGTDIDMFRMYQEEIEDIAQTEENTPARKIFFNQVDPLQKVIVSNLTRMLKLELKNPHTVERRGLASLMSDIEATTTLAIEKIEEYLLSGSNKFQEEFKHHWNNNNRHYMYLETKASILSDEQRVALKRLSEARSEVAPLFKKIIAIRSSDDWNKANYKLKTQAAPIAASINHFLNEMVTSQNKLLKKELAAVNKQTHFLIVILVGWFIVGGLISGVLGATITRGISVPLEGLSRIMNGLNKGDFRQKPLDALTRDELGELILKSNALVEKLRVFRRHSANLLSGNLKVQEFDLEGDFKTLLDGMVKLAREKENNPASDKPE